MSGTRHPSSLAQSKDHAQPDQAQTATGLKLESSGEDSSLLSCLPYPDGEPPHPLHEEDPSPVQPQSPSHACLLSPNPGGLHPPFISPPLFILQSSLASRHLREASDPPPTQLSALPKPQPPPPDSITCPHPSPPFCSNPGLHARLFQPSPQARGIDIPHPPR